MHLSVPYTLGSDEKFSVGRVQEPTLAMVVSAKLAHTPLVAEGKSTRNRGRFPPTGRVIPGRLSAEDIGVRGSVGRWAI